MAGGEVLRVCALSATSHPLDQSGSSLCIAGSKEGRRECGGKRPSCFISQKLLLWLQDIADDFQGGNFVLATSQAPEPASAWGLTGEVEVEDACVSENFHTSEVLTMGRALGGTSRRGGMVSSGHGRAAAPVQSP